MNKREIECVIIKQKKAVLVVNTHSRKGERLFFKALDLLQAKGIDIVAAYPVQKPQRLKQVVTDIINEGHPLIIIGGGDGTFNTVTELFAHKEVVLGILPMGTANNFARSMGIPMNLEKAIDVITSGKVVDVDLGMINDQYFTNIATVGFSKDVISATPHCLKRYLGVVSYLLYETKYLLSQELFECIITIGEMREHIRTRQLIIANGSFYGTRKIAPDAHIDNRTLFIIMMDSLSRLQGLKFWIGFMMGRHLQFPESRVFKTNTAYIETSPRKYVIMGGEKSTRTPIQISIDPEAVFIMAPKLFLDFDD